MSIEPLHAEMMQPKLFRWDRLRPMRPLAEPGTGLGRFFAKSRLSAWNRGA